MTADCVDMSHEVIDRHYDKATKNEQMVRREDYFVAIKLEIVFVQKYYFYWWFIGEYGRQR